MVPTKYWEVRPLSSPPPAVTTASPPRLDPSLSRLATGLRSRPVLCPRDSSPLSTNLRGTKCPQSCECGLWAVVISMAEGRMHDTARLVWADLSYSNLNLCDIYLLFSLLTPISRQVNKPRLQTFNSVLYF